MTNQSVSLNPNQLLEAFIQNLNSLFFAVARDDSKRQFQLIHDGERVPLMRIDMQEAGEIHCELGLDRSEYQGKLNFAKFRKSTASMLSVISKRLENQERVQHLSSEQGEMLFNLPGITDDEKDGINVMACSIKPLAPGLMLLKLMYMEPKQYQDALKQAALTNSGSTKK